MEFAYKSRIRHATALFLFCVSFYQIKVIIEISIYSKIKAETKVLLLRRGSGVWEGYSEPAVS
jgi:hypothetical protein